MRQLIGTTVILGLSLCSRAFATSPWTVDDILLAEPVDELVLSGGSSTK